MVVCTRVFVEVVITWRVGMSAHGIARAVSGVVGPKVFEPGLLRRSGGSRLGVLSRRVEPLERSITGAIVFTPGRGVSEGEVRWTGMYRFLSSPRIAYASLTA